MIPSVLSPHLYLAFLLGFGWVTLVAEATARWGPERGGFLGGLPSTTPLAFFLIGWNQSPEAAAQATTIFPLIFGFTGSFLLFYALLAKKGFGLAMAVSLSIWFGLSALTIVSGFDNFIFSLAGCISVSVTTYYLFTKNLKLENRMPNQEKNTILQRLLRATISGGIISLAVLMSQLGGPIVGGVFSAFPAVFASTLYVVNESQGMDVSRTMALPLMVTGTLTIVPYSITVRYLYPDLGIWLGTLAAYFVALSIAYLLYRQAYSWEVKETRSVTKIPMKKAQFHTNDGTDSPRSTTNRLIRAISAEIT